MPTTEDLADDLATAVGGSEIFAVFQPQVSLESGSVVAAEALCRWSHPQLGDVDPGTMIAVAERSGVIHPLGRRMLDEGLDMLGEWRADGRDWAVAVNVSPLQFDDETFVGHVASELARRGFAPGSLVLELANDLQPGHDAIVLPRLCALRDLGVEISLAGYSAEPASLERLERLGSGSTGAALRRGALHQPGRHARQHRALLRQLPAIGLPGRPAGAGLRRRHRGGYGRRGAASLR